MGDPQLFSIFFFPGAKRQKASSSYFSIAARAAEEEPSPRAGVGTGPGTLLPLLVYQWFWSQDLSPAGLPWVKAIYRPRRARLVGSQPKPAVHSLFMWAAAFSQGRCP